MAQKEDRLLELAADCLHAYMSVLNERSMFKNEAHVRYVYDAIYKHLDAVPDNPDTPLSI